MQAQVQLINPLVVIIDTLRDVHSAQENDSTEMRNMLLELLSATQPAICGIIAHRKKEKSKVCTPANATAMPVPAGSARKPGRAT